MRIRVSDVLDLFAAGLTPEQILEEMPDLETADLEACLKFCLSVARSRRIRRLIVFSGLVFIGVLGMLLAPFVHRIMHRLHFEDERAH